MPSVQANIDCQIETVSCCEGSMAQGEHHLSALTGSRRL
jgi:hypothetical protein